MTLDKSVLICIICGKTEQEGHKDGCANAPKSESDKVYEDRQGTYTQPLSYVIGSILRNQLGHYHLPNYDSLVKDINAAIETSERNE